MFKIVIASFQMENKLEKALIFQKTFLLVDIIMYIVLEISFFTFSNANIQFVEKKLI